MPLTNSGKRVVGKPKNASRARTAGASMPRAKLDTSRSAANAMQSITPGYKNNTVTSQSQWGGVAPTGKAAAQSIVLQFSGASGALGLVFFVATYVLSVDKKYTPKTFVYIPVLQWLYIKSYSYFFGLIYGILMKMYWGCNDFQGRSKVKTFFAYLILDFLLACWTVISILVGLERGEMDFYWFFVILCCFSIILIPCEIVKLCNIIDSEIKRKRIQKRTNGRNNSIDIESKVSHDIESKSSSGGDDNAIPTAIASPVSTPQIDTSINQFKPSAPSIRSNNNGTDDLTLNGIELHIANTETADFTLLNNPQLEPSQFEEMWVNMPSCGGFYSKIQYYPEIATMNEHLKKQGFGITASGLVGTGTRLFLYGIEDHQFTSRPGYEQTSGIFLCELILTMSDDGKYFCKATYKCSKPGLADTFENYLMLHEMFGDIYL
jgi:hypothetical protein